MENRYLYDCICTIPYWLSFQNPYIQTSGRKFFFVFSRKKEQLHTILAGWEAFGNGISSNESFCHDERYRIVSYVIVSYRIIFLSSFIWLSSLVLSSFLFFYMIVWAWINGEFVVQAHESVLLMCMGPAWRYKSKVNKAQAALYWPIRKYSAII